MSIKNDLGGRISTLIFDSNQKRDAKMGIGKRIEDDINPLISKENRREYNKSSNQKNDVTFIPETPKFSLDDIILPDNVKNKILDAAEYAENRQIVFEKWGLSKTHKFSKRIGINLYGPPGTGKTMAAHAIAHHLKRKILLVNYADIESKYVGETPKNIRRVFDVAKETHSILFFDEADAILSKRVTNMSNATDVSVNQTRSVMLMIMNEYQDFIIFATNFIENFDPAFMRRISLHVKFNLPDEECRKRLWELYLPPELPTNLDCAEIAKEYEGLSGSDISNAVLNAAFKAARQHVSYVDKVNFYDAIEDILSSKRANERGDVIVTKRTVSEDYVKEQLKMS